METGLFWTDLGVCVEQLEQRHDQLIHADVSVPVLLHVVAHGLTLGLRQQVAGLLLQHGPGLVDQAGQGHLRTGHAPIEARLQEKKKNKKQSFILFIYLNCRPFNMILL